VRFLSTLLLFFGYALVYAAVADGGKFATDPRLVLFADAYTGKTVVGSKNSDSTTAPQSVSTQSSTASSSSAMAGVTQVLTNGRSV